MPISTIPRPIRFRPAGANSYARLYHTVALLMPDATVWVAGGNPTRGTYEQHMEIYKPAYLFTRDVNNNVVAATRPTISSVQSTITWGGQFSVFTPDAANISSAVLMRPGSSTHAFDMSARMVGLDFTAGAGALTVTGPPNANIAPPGYYMLFLINNQGVPSVAKFLLLNNSGGGAPAPNPTGISPASGTTGGGTPVTITGTGFAAGATVKFGGTSATGVTVGSSTSITATTPAHAAGTVDVVVTNTDSQSGTLSGGYTYTSGSGGGGIGFVQSNSAPATIQASNSSVAASFVAAQTAGNLNVVVVGWGNTAAINSVSDSRGNTYALAVGPTSGSGLRQSLYYAKNIAGGSNTVTVTFSPAAAYPDVRILEYSGLDASSPLDKTAGAAGTGTTANSGSATTTVANELIFGAGTSGTRFSAAGSGYTSRMINVYGNIVEDKTVSSTGSYNATATEVSGVWVMQMATFRGSGQGGAPAPTVATISPTSGTTAGGTAVSITGTGFVAGATVKLGGTAATNVNVVGSTSITATTAAHAAGAVDVVVTNRDAQSGTLTQGFTYTTPSNPAPTVATISPTSGTTAGGTPVSITGTGFVAGATVKLGGTAATNVNVVGSTSITATTAAHAAGAVDVVVTNSDAQSGTLTQGFTYTTPSNPAPTVATITPDVGHDRRRNGSEHHGDGLPGGSDGEAGRDGGDECECGGQHVDHGDDGGACGGRGRCGGDQQRCAERNLDPGIHLYDAVQSGADGGDDHADVGHDGGRNGSEHHGDGLPGGSDGEAGRDSGDECERGGQHVDHGDDGGACGGRGRCGGDQHGWQERHADQRVHLHGGDGGSDRLRAVELGTEHDPGVEHDGGGDLSGGADGGGLEYRGGGVGRYDVDDQLGERQPGERVHAGGRTDDREGAAAVDLLRQEYRRGKHDGDGDVQSGGGISGRADPGVQRSGHEQSAGQDGGSSGDGDDGEQRIGDHDDGERVDLWGGNEWHALQRGGVGIYLADDQPVRQHRGRQDGPQHGELQRHGDRSFGRLGDADGYLQGGSLA